MYTQKKTNLFENSIFNASIVDESFFLLEVKEDTEVGLESAIEYMAFNECLAKICEGGIPVLTHSKGLISLNKDARRYIHGFKNSTAYLANAIVVERLASRAMMQFIMKLIPSTKFPELVFDSISNASFWLGQEMNKNAWKLPSITTEDLSDQLEGAIQAFINREKMAMGLSSS